jgi:hypothetical protein
LGLNYANREINKDTLYNSVFYGILKDSNNPAQDLIDMGLNPDMAVEAGKHAYLDNEEYVTYIPLTPITQEAFYNKMSNGKLVKFYITHPARLLQGMKYTASESLATSTVLGKYSQEYSETPISDFNRFTQWSSFRENHLPHNLFFLALIFTAVLIMSLIIYMKNKEFQDIKSRIQILWGVILIGLIQFPMPYVGNGQADTAKQLFLFNFVFDIVFVVSICWFFGKITDFFSDKYHLNNKSSIIKPRKINE